MKKINWAFMLLLTTFLFACSNDEEVLEQENQVTNTTTPQKKLNGKIPFTTENVQNALPAVIKYYETFKPEVADRFRNYAVKPTHIYYKFTPTDSLQYSMLMEQDNILNLTTDPFEYNVVERTEDPADNEIPVFYAVVNSSERIPQVPYEKVAELHFTDEDKLEDVEQNYDEIEFKQNLMYEARKLAGHLDDQELKEGYWDIRKENQEQYGETAAKGLFPKKWRPSGSVKVEDDHYTNMRNITTYFSVKNCEVTVLKWGWLRVESGITNQDGNFITGTTYTTHVHYNVKFTDFGRVKVRSGNFFDIANYKSDSHKRRALDAKFNRNTKMQFYALVNNAAWDYFDRVVPTYQINNPQTIDISAHWEGNDKSNYVFGGIPFRSEVKVSRNKNGVYRGSDGIYAVVIHEMTHKGHYRMDNGAFGIFGGSKALFFRETWAKCVERQATNDKYTQWFVGFNIGPYVASYLVGTTLPVRTWDGDRQLRTVANQDEYSEVFIDLMDNFNQSTWNNTLPNEIVTGYTLNQIQTALNNSRSVDTFFEKLRNSYVNPTENNLQPIQDYANTIVNSL